MNERGVFWNFYSTPYRYSHQSKRAKKKAKSRRNQPKDSRFSILPTSMFGRSKKNSESEGAPKEKKTNFVRRILRKSKPNPVEEKEVDVDLQAPPPEVMLNTRTLSKKLKQVVEEFKEEEGIDLTQSVSPKEFPTIEIPEDDPRIATMQRKGSFQVVEGGTRVSRDQQQIEVPTVWVTTPEVVG